MTTPDNKTADRTQKQPNANVLLVDSRVQQQAFEKALGTIPEIELLSAGRTGSQTAINIFVSGQKSGQILKFLQKTVQSLPGFEVRIQGATLGPVPTVVCKVATATQPETRGSRFRRTRTIEPQPETTATAPPAAPPVAAPTAPPPTGATEVPGFRPEPDQVFTPQPTSVPTETRLPSVVNFTAVWNFLRNTLIVVLFLFGDVELALARWHRRRNRPTTTSKFNLKNSATSSGKNALIGTGFIFGDIEIGYRKLRKSRPGISKQNLTTAAMSLGVISLLIRALVETIFGHDQTETEPANDSPKT